MAKTIRGKTGWPGKKRTYHTGRKRCRYLNDMRAERKTENEQNAKARAERKPRIVGRREDLEARARKKNRRYVRDHRGRRIRLGA